MRIIDGLVHGPFKSEQEFKRSVIRAWQKSGLNQTFFEIENEEKEPGMPDVLAVLPSLPAFFTEFKYADKNGVIEFRKSQPLFYWQHPDLLIQILAWDSRAEGRVVHLDPSEVVEAKALRITLPADIDTAVGYDPEEDAVRHGAGGGQ
jgi:hypothetical protein